MRRPIMNRDHIAVNQSYEGETIEAKVRRVVNNKEPITDGAPLVYQEAKEGVQPAYDIRADKWDIATDAMDKVHQETVARRKAKVVKMERDRDWETLMVHHL